MNEGKKDRRDPIRTIKAKNPVAKNANKAIGGGAAGAHKDKKKAAKQGDVKHKKAEYAESLQNKLDAVLAEGFFGDIKQSFATGMVDKLKKAIPAQYHKHYDFDSVKSPGDTKAIVARARAAGHLKEASVAETRGCPVCGQTPCNCTHISNQKMKEAYGPYSRKSASDIERIKKHKEREAKSTVPGQLRKPESAAQKEKNFAKHMKGISEGNIPPDGTPEYDQFINRGGVNQKTPFDLGGADAYYGRQHDITAEYGFQKGSPEWDEYIQGYRDTYQNSDMRKDYGGGRSAVHPRRITKTSEAMNGITGPGMMRDPAMEAPEEPEGDTLKNSLHTIIRVATHLDKRLSVNDDFPEWVSEKVGAVKGMMVNVMDYLISDQEMSHDTDAMEDTALTQHRKRSSQADADFAKREAARKKNPGAASSDRIKELEKRYPAKEGWTHDSLADQLFEHERTYEEKLANDLKRKLGK
jgi:hypothetical protein